MKKLYNARWTTANLSTIANISFYAANDEAAKKQARKEAKKMRLVTSTCTIYQDAKFVCAE